MDTLVGSAPHHVDDERFCPVTQTMRLLEQKWTLQIVKELVGGKRRFCQLQHALRGDSRHGNVRDVNPKTLSQRLKTLEAYGIVTRRMISDIPPNVEYELTGMGRGGEATGWLDGQKVFAGFGLPGERVELDVGERRPDRLWGRVVRVLRPSPHRVAPHCPYFGTCGGCQWQHVDYQQQLDFKTAMVATHLADGAGFANPPVLPTLPSPAVYGYRNHARFSIGRRHGELGFTTHFGHRFMRVDHCPIMHPRIDEVLTATQGRARGHQLAVRIGVQTGDLLVNPAQQDPDLPYESGQPWLEEELLGRRYRVSAAAFFQVNTWQAERLIEVGRAAVEA